MKFQAIFLFAIILKLSNGATVESPISSNLPPFESGPLSVDVLKIAPKLTFLGTVNGKNYYLEATSQVNWAGAKSFCTGLGMKMAYFSSFDETDFLAPKINSAVYFWTAGIMTHGLSHFNWEGTSGNMPAYTFAQYSSNNNLGLSWRGHTSYKNIVYELQRHATAYKLCFI